jgi:hypothetical protein
MCQTTLTQCFNAAAAPAPAQTSLPSGYHTIVIGGKKYLLNDTTNHLMIVPTVAASVAAQSITPIALDDFSFKNSVTLSVKKGPPPASKKRRNKNKRELIVAAEHVAGNNSSNATSDGSSIIYVRAKKKRRIKKNILDLVSSPDSSADDKVTVAEALVKVVLPPPPSTPPPPVKSIEVESQDLPKTSDFAGNMRKSMMMSRRLRLHVY